MNRTKAIRGATLIALAVFCSGSIPPAVAQTGSAAAAGYPDETSTGVPPGTALTKQTGVIEITTDGTVLENIDLVGAIIVKAKDVTVRKSRITSATPWHLIYVIDGNTGFRLEDSELIGNGTTVNGVLGYGDFVRNNIHGFENGLNIWGPARVEGNYIHGLAGGPEAHFDAIECNAGSDVSILGNTLMNENTDTSALMINNEFGPLENWVIDGNRMSGGGYTMYIDPRKSARPVGNIRITNNRWGKGYYGYNAFYGFAPDVWSGNVDDVTGAPVLP